ncbi:hypothetical protein LP7551_04941 [Roseibium album]|nr:hypothetical protein LP7551_04941 [Roseibium album]
MPFVGLMFELQETDRPRLIEHGRMSNLAAKTGVDHSDCQRPLRAGMFMSCEGWKRDFAATGTNGRCADKTTFASCLHQAWRYTGGLEFKILDIRVA